MRKRLHILFLSLKSDRLIADSFWSLIGSIVGRGLALIAGILVARFLNAEVFGEYAIIRNTILMIAMFSTLGLGYTSTKYVAELKNKEFRLLSSFTTYVMRVTFIFSSIMALFVFLFADYLATIVFEAPNLNNALRILSVLIIFNSLTTTQLGVLAGLGVFKNIARINSIVGVITFISSVVLSYYYGLNGALGALLLVQIINWILNYRLVKRIVYNELSTEKLNLIFKREILNFTTPIAMQEMTYSVTTWIAPLILVKYASYSELGMFNAAIQWNALILFIPGILRNVILSHLSESNKDFSKHAKIMRTTIFINFGITAICALGVFLFSGVISDMYGRSFDGLSSLISVAVFTTIFVSISNVYSQAYMSKGLNWTMYFIRLIRDLGVLSLAFILLKYNIGTKGAALKLILSSLVLNVIFMIIMIYYYNRIAAKEQVS